MHVRGALSELQLHLGKLDALRRAEDVGVSHRLHTHHRIEVRLLDLAARARHVIGVLVGQVLAKAFEQQPELQRLRVMQALVDAGHDHGAALQQRQGRSDLRVLVAVANLHVGGAGQALAGIHKEPQQRKQHLAGLFVGQRHQRGRKLGPASVNVAPFARLDGVRVVRDARALGFEARRQVCKCSGVDQLP